MRRSEAELVLAELLELAPEGVEEVDRGDIVEYAIYGAPGELPQLPQLEAVVGGALVEVQASEIADDWHERWRRFHQPVTLPAPGGGSVGGLHVRPPWEPAMGEPQIQEIVIDPGQAFGTGAHATTKLCLQLLLELAGRQDGGAVVDVGTGSGVLAIAAAKLGFQPVLACDHDPKSVCAAEENARANGVEIEVLRLDLRDGPPPLPAGATVLANLLRPLLLSLANGIVQAPTHLIAGGLLTGEVEEVASAFAERHRMHEHARREQGEWAATWLVAA